MHSLADVLKVSANGREFFFDVGIHVSTGSNNPTIVA
jgi:hypothetical protein